MQLLDETTIRANFERYIKGLQFCLGDELTDKLLEKYAKQLIVSPNGRYTHTGGFAGGFVNNALKVSDAAHISAKLFKGTSRELDPKSITKLALLNGFAKIVNFVEVKNSYHNQRGQYYDNITQYDDNSSSTVNEETIFMLNELGITFSRQEYHAFLALSKKDEANAFNTNALFVLLSGSIGIARVLEKDMDPNKNSSNNQ